MFSKTTVAPLDRVKILLQAHNRHYKQHGTQIVFDKPNKMLSWLFNFLNLYTGVFSGLAKIVKFENLWALYKGNGAQMVRIFPYAATQFTSYEIYKSTFGNLMNQHHFSKFFAGSAAGITAVLLTYPLDTIRARLAFQVTGEHKYSGIMHTAVTMFKEVTKLCTIKFEWIVICQVFYVTDRRVVVKLCIAVSCPLWLAWFPMRDCHFIVLKVWNIAVWSICRIWRVNRAQSIQVNWRINFIHLHIFEKWPIISINVSNLVWTQVDSFWNFGLSSFVEDSLAL